MGFPDALYELRIPYASSEAVLFADESMAAVCYYTYCASTDVARERGLYYQLQGLAAVPGHPADRHPSGACLPTGSPIT